MNKLISVIDENRRERRVKVRAMLLGERCCPCPQTVDRQDRGAEVGGKVERRSTRGEDRNCGESRGGMERRGKASMI